MSNIKTHPLYSTISSMMNRCYRDYHKDFPRYGGKGIVMDESWRRNARKCIGDIEDAIGPRPSPAHTIDRIDTNGNYEIGNIRWATMREQNNNRNNNRKVTVKGRTLNVVQWARRMGVSRQMIRYRLEAGWSDEDAVLKPAGYGNRSKK